MKIREIFSDEKVYSPLEYAQTFCMKEESVAHIYDHNTLREWMDENGHGNKWDLPISEIDEIIEHNVPVVLVAVTVNGEIQARYYETNE